MKIQVSISAKDLPSEADVYATVKLDGAEVGKTDVEKNTDNPAWSKMVVMEAEPAMALSVVVMNAASGSEMGSVSFDIQAVLEQNGNAMAKSMQDGGTIAVHMAEHSDCGMLRLQLRGRKFKNMEGFLNRSDPYFELQGLQRETVYRSIVIENNLNPVWPVAEVDVNALTGGDLDAPIKVLVFDRDAKGTRDFMGGFELSIHGFLSAKEVIDMKKENKKTGEIQVEGAQLVPQDKVSPQNMEAMEAVAVEEAARWVLQNKVKAARQTAAKMQQAAMLAKEKASAAEELAKTRVSQAEAAAEELTQAEQDAVTLEEAANKASKDAKERGCTGTFKLHLRGTDFKDTDGFRNLSDPFYEMFGVKGDTAFRSKVMDNNLNPVWPEAQVDVGELCGGDFDVPIRVAFFDDDEGKTKDYFGQLQLSINGFLEAKAAEPIQLAKGGQQVQGNIFVEGAEVVDFKDLKEEAAKAREASLEAKRQVHNKSEAVTAAKKEAKEAQDAADKAANAATDAEKVADAAQEALATAEAAL